MKSLSDFIANGPFPREWTDEHWAGKEGYVGNKISSIRIFSNARPHMSAFHAAWISFFLVTLMWFAIPGILPSIKKPICLAQDHPICESCRTDPKYFNAIEDSIDWHALAIDKTCKLCAPHGKHDSGCGGMGQTGLSRWYTGPDKGPLPSNFSGPLRIPPNVPATVVGMQASDVISSNLAGVAGSIIVRYVIGPFSEQYGVRLSLTLLLICAAIPGFLICLARPGDLISFNAARFFISCSGASFVTTTLWTSTMFSYNVVGLAAATAAGWGNLGAGVALAIMPPIYTALGDCGYTNDEAWRITICWPPVLLLVYSFYVFCFTDDSPNGNYVALRNKTGAPPQNSTMVQSMKQAAANYRTWILAFQYAFSYGIEVTLELNATLYFVQAWGMDQETAGGVAGIIQLVNIFARSLGGHLSDKAGKGFGIVGRLWVHFWLLVIGGALLVGFGSLSYEHNSLGQLYTIWILYSVILAMSTGTCFGIYPFVEPTACGGVSSIVGTAGNVGSVIGTFVWGMGGRPGIVLLGYLQVYGGIFTFLMHFQDTREGSGGSMCAGGIPWGLGWVRLRAGKAEVPMSRAVPAESKSQGSETADPTVPAIAVSTAIAQEHRPTDTSAAAEAAAPQALTT